MSYYSTGAFLSADGSVPWSSGSSSGTSEWPGSRSTWGTTAGWPRSSRPRWRMTTGSGWWTTSRWIWREKIQKQQKSVFCVRLDWSAFGFSARVSWIRSFWRRSMPLENSIWCPQTSMNISLSDSVFAHRTQLQRILVRLTSSLSNWLLWNPANNEKIGYFWYLLSNWI